MPYTTEDGVYETTGFSSEIIQEVLEVDITEVTSLVSGWISDSEGKLKDDTYAPYVIRKELHLGTGYDNQFLLGPQDEEYSTTAGYDPEDGLEQIHDVWFSRFKKKRPYPVGCDIDGDLATVTGWSGTATPANNTVYQVQGTNCVAITYTGGGEYVQYPDGTNISYLDRHIGSYGYIFFYLRSNAVVTFTLRLYDTDGNYEEQTFSPRQANVGQYFWLHRDTLTGSISWSNSSTRLQYFRIYADGACIVYLDNFCFADDWAYTAPAGTLHIAKADNISSSGFPSENYPYYATYSYDPFLASVPSTIKEAVECLVGVAIIDHLR